MGASGPSSHLHKPLQQMLGTPNFDQRPFLESVNLGVRAEGAQHDNSVPMDAFPISFILPMATFASSLVCGPKFQAPPPPPQPPRPVRTADLSDAMAVQVEKLSNQRTRDADHFKAVLAQSEVEMEETKARWQQEAAQKLAEYQAEQHLSQAPTTQAMQDQRNQRELEVQREEFQAKNKTMKERMARQLKYEVEVRIAKDSLFP